MSDLCDNVISLPGVENFRKTIQPFLHDRLEKVYMGKDHQDNEIYRMLPTGIPCMEREIDLDFNRIIPMPEAIKNTQKEEFSQFTLQGKLLRSENLYAYGNEDWYDWSMENWGAKWSYYGKFLRDEKSFLFCTPWCPPIRAIEKLAQILQTTVQIDYVDGYEMGCLGRCQCRPDRNNHHVSYEYACEAPLPFHLDVMGMLTGVSLENYEKFKKNLIADREFWLSYHQKSNA